MEVSSLEQTNASITVTTNGLGVDISNVIKSIRLTLGVSAFDSMEIDPPGEKIMVQESVGKPLAFDRAVLAEAMKSIRNTDVWPGYKVPVSVQDHINGVRFDMVFKSFNVQLTDREKEIYETVFSPESLIRTDEMVVGRILSDPLYKEYNVVEYVMNVEKDHYVPVSVLVWYLKSLRVIYLTPSKWTWDHTWSVNGNSEYTPINGNSVSIAFSKEAT